MLTKEELVPLQPQVSYGYTVCMGTRVGKVQLDAIKVNIHLH